MRIILLILLNCLFISNLISQNDSLLIQKLRLIKFTHNYDNETPIDTPTQTKKQYDIEINELIVNETISKAGNEFHELFYGQWTWPDQLTSSFIIVIKEKPLRGSMTQVSLIINDMLIFEMPVQARFDYLESIAEMASVQAKGYLNNYKEIMRSLEGEDVQGSGIF